jgi:hypothetical protein
MRKTRALPCVCGHSFAMHGRDWRGQRECKVLREYKDGAYRRCTCLGYKARKKGRKGSVNP